ncbi:hypothetical protein NTH44_003597 [Vibrio metoecus]|nr:hypothetical protein [Vibrio cholerae]
MSLDILYHGTRAHPFDKFDLMKLGSGEGCNAADGFYFASSLLGAANHARYRSRQEGEPCVYVCRFKHDAKVLTLGNAIFLHNEKVQSHWNSLPVWPSCIQSENWYGELGFTPELSLRKTSILDERKKCRYLRNFGFDAIMDFESGAFLDSYLHGRSHLLLNPEAIEIIEILKVEQIQSELSGKLRHYTLNATEQPLGTTGVFSKLRAI